MNSDESDLEELLDDGMERIRTVLDASENGDLPDEEAESVRESADAIAERVTDASLGELLTASGFDDDSDDVAPADLPMLMQDADPDAMLDLRHMLELTNLSDAWSDLDDEERLDRLERIGEDTTDDSHRSVRDLLSGVLSRGESDEATADNEKSEGPESEGEEGEDSDEDVPTVEEFRSLVNDIKESGDESGEQAEGAEERGTEDHSEGGSESGGRSRRRATSRHSTMPSSRSDMGSRKRHSTVRGKD
jgi:hypothetical protein